MLGRQTFVITVYIVTEYKSSEENRIGLTMKVNDLNYIIYFLATFYMEQ